LGRGSLVELGITLVIMANEVSMMWEHLFDAECSRVCTRRVNALVIDELTAVKFILYADTNMIKHYNDNNKKICTGTQVR
jgi:hypothetical protein